MAMNLPANENIGVTVLGSGNAFSTDGRGNAAYLLQTPRAKLLIDCGPSILQKAESLKIDLRGIDAVLLTHFHGDHAMGVPFLMLFVKYIERREKPFTIVGPPGVTEWVNHAVELCYPDVSFPFKVYFEELDLGQKKSMFYLDIETVKMQHKEESVGYRISYKDKTVAFSGDTEWHRSLKRLCDGTNLSFVECSSINKLQAAHVSLEEIKESEVNYLRGSEQVVLTHLYNELAREIEKTDLGFTPAHDGARYSV